jgi:hypothetical protein
VIVPNQKFYTSQNMMAICDFDLRFAFVVVGWPGSIHDTHVWFDVKCLVHYSHPPEGNPLCTHFLIKY